MVQYYVGIDPGATGGLGIVDQEGRYVHASRWDEERPRAGYDRLALIRDEIVSVYLEMINPHPGQGVGHVASQHGLIINYGIWQGLLLALDLAPVIIHPRTWQAAYHLHNWQRRRQEGIQVESPLELARRHWPGAPLQYLKDDGKAVALILAHMAWDDARLGRDRREMVKAQKAKTDAARKLARARKRAASAWVQAPAPLPIGQLNPPHDFNF